MDISIANYRNRIGNFNQAGHFSYIPEKNRKQSYKTSSRNNYNYRKLFTFIVLLISIISKLDLVLEEKNQGLDPHFEYIGTLATATLPACFFIVGGQVPSSFFPVNHLSYHDVVGVHSAATLQGVQVGAVHLDRGLIVAAAPRQYSILSDSNFYAKYTYGNRANKGIKLSHWNAGSANLENKTIEIENVISDHHTHQV